MKHALVFLAIAAVVSCGSGVAAAQAVPGPGRSSVHGEQPSRERSSAPEKNDILVTFVELGSVNCVPCKMMQPVMAAIEKEYGDRVKVVFHDVWTKEGRPYGEKYRIQAIPTQVFLDKDGKEFFRHMGYFPKEEIIKVLRKQGVK